LIPPFVLYGRDAFDRGVRSARIVTGLGESKTASGASRGSLNRRVTMRTSPSGFPLGCGTVFKLAPKSGGRYTESVLYTFQGGTDGAFPYAPVIADASGALYGTTGDGGAIGAGSVFELAPNGKQYTESLLYSFQSTPDGNFPRAGLIDVSGTLYSTTFGGGTYGYGSIFSVTP